MSTSGYSFFKTPIQRVKEELVKELQNYGVPRDQTNLYLDIVDRIDNVKTMNIPLLAAAFYFYYRNNELTPETFTKEEVDPIIDGLMNAYDKKKKTAKKIGVERSVIFRRFKQSLIRYITRVINVMSEENAPVLHFVEPTSDYLEEDEVILEENDEDVLEEEDEYF